VELAVRRLGLVARGATERCAGFGLTSPPGIGRAGGLSTAHRLPGMARTIFSSSNLFRAAARRQPASGRRGARLDGKAGGTRAQAPAMTGTLARSA